MIFLRDGKICFIIEISGVDHEGMLMGYLSGAVKFSVAMASSLVWL
jgi:hypothetical protein